MIVTAFLGFLYSPIWLKFNKNLYNNNNHQNNTTSFGIYIRKILNHSNSNSYSPSFHHALKKTRGRVLRFGGLNNQTWNQRSFSNYSYNSLIVRSTPNNPENMSLTKSLDLFPDPTQKSLEHPVVNPPACGAGKLEKFLLEKNLNPVFIYENLSNNTIKTLLKNETRNLSGIYLILNKFTLDYYIGSASTDKLYARFINHLFNFNGSKVVKNAVKKYKISSFAFIVLELFPEIVNKENNKKLLDLEDFYLKTLLPNYNILTEAGSSFGYKHSEITRIKMKENYSDERRKAIGNLNRNKKYDAKAIELMRQSAFNRKKPIYSEQAKENMKKKSKGIIVYNFDYTVYGEFSSIVNGGKSLGCSERTIRRALKNPKNILRRR